ncbi:hypothetical protein JX580_10290 [Thiomicrospira microaerophila]|uniref:hypothetical protein n=1 Tax=Thiomicrospira microaerophila TaxID=406020 RepID=UPI0020108067|nr:hypothetical protein [Thiomicrospira microaerophila]UQB42037.1 hypothetical protein JX580_10290 [Thiomicrospira microaerophila]
MGWQEHIDFLHAWPELHSLLAAYLAVEEEGEEKAILLFVEENPRALCRLRQQLEQLINSNNAEFCQQAALLAGRQQGDQAWLQGLLAMLDRTMS